MRRGGRGSIMDDIGQSAAGGPPLLTGGVGTQANGVFESESAIWDFGLDWMQFSTSAKGDRLICSQTEPRQGDPRRLRQAGFEQAEYRLCLGGECRRAWQPYSPSLALGPDYAHWIFSGQQAPYGARYGLSVAPEIVKPTRIDVAFDLAVDFSPADVRQSLPWDRDATEWHESGDKGSKGRTLYVGGRSSPVRCVVYEKGKEQAAVPEAFMPCDRDRWLRVELRLRDVEAQSWWTKYEASQADAFELVKGRIRAMTAIDLGPCQSWKSAAVPSAPDAVRSALHLIDQYGLLIETLDRAGVDLMGLSRLRASLASRRPRWQAQKNLDQLQRMEGVNEWLSLLVMERGNGGFEAIEAA